MVVHMLAIGGLICLVLGFIMGVAFCRARNVRTVAQGKEREEELQAFVAARTLELSLANKELKKARAAAEEANQAKSMFLASMSHDLRTPLNAIIGFSELILQESFGPISPARYREYLADVKSSGDVLLELLNNILDLSKLEAGRRDVSPAVLDGQEFVRQCLKLVRRPAEAKSIRLEMECDRDCTLYVDELAGREILLNLLTNAVKFTPEGGEVRIRLKGKIDRGSELIVSDTGIGMDADGIQLALEPYRQAHKSHAPTSSASLLETKNLQGSGLGLPITARLVELHKGRLNIVSVLGEGTSIHVWLPMGVEDLEAEPGQLFDNFAH